MNYKNFLLFSLQCKSAFNKKCLGKFTIHTVIENSIFKKIILRINTRDVIKVLYRSSLLWKLI